MNPTSFLTTDNEIDGDAVSGYQELCNFSLSTLRALIKEEERGPHGSSSLSKLCRLDIGVMERQAQCYYFVSEVERTVGLGIFGDTQVEKMAQHLAKVWLPMLT